MKMNEMTMESQGFIGTPAVLRQTTKRFIDASTYNKLYGISTMCLFSRFSLRVSRLPQGLSSVS